MAKARRAKADAMQVPQATVENPMWSRAHHGDKSNPRFITVQVNPRESAISELASRQALNEAQVAAADMFRRLFEAMGGSGARGIDTTREFVEGGRFPDPIGDRAITAGKKLALAHEALVKAHGLYGWRLVGYICGEGYSIRELLGQKDDDKSSVGRRQRDTMTDNLRAYLDCLAAHWQLSTRVVSYPKRLDPRARK
jgi:hypothetical protein